MCEHRYTEIIQSSQSTTVKMGVEWCSRCGAVRETLDGPTGPIASPWKVPRRRPDTPKGGA